MTPYIISYDLLNPGQDYRSLHQAIRELDPGSWHGLESFWIVRSAYSAGQIRDHLLHFLDANDRLLVIAAAPEWASSLTLPNRPRLHQVTGTQPVNA